MNEYAIFFVSQADRDAAYKALVPLLTGTDHGVSGGVKDAFGNTPQWQLWANDKVTLASVQQAIGTTPATIGLNGTVIS